MDNNKKKKNDEEESRFLEAPFVRMRSMRSASLKKASVTWSQKDKGGASSWE